MCGRCLAKLCHPYVYLGAFVVYPSDAVPRSTLLLGEHVWLVVLLCAASDKVSRMLCRVCYCKHDLWEHLSYALAGYKLMTKRGVDPFVAVPRRLRRVDGLGHDLKGEQFAISLRCDGRRLLFLFLLVFHECRLYVAVAANWRLRCSTLYLFVVLNVWGRRCLGMQNIRRFFAWSARSPPQLHSNLHGYN